MAAAASSAYRLSCTVSAAAARSGDGIGICRSVVSSIYADASIGNSIKIAVVHILYLHQDLAASSKLDQNGSKDQSYVPSAAIKVTFAGTLLPDFVEVQNLRLPVRPFFPKPMFCHCRIFKAKEKALRKKTRQSLKSSSNTIIRQTPTESQPGVSTTEDPASTRTNEGPRVSSYKLKKQAQATSSGTTPSSNNIQNRTNRTQINDPPKCKKKKSDPHTPANVPSYSNSYPIELIISRICSVYQIDQSFVDLITTLMPIIKIFWGKIIEAAPLLGHFISP
ncbi:conserved hypothetical protein [Culex quinquefasciatus]|uniref:Uncharacterized protein n=1 Tax=Culex quinquefasciatus TaxID=7176 RepID=B0WU61_CULQU|nr:conserved hypothetical protein [Culex quinquefasciatus]|eukprot:XP_001857960.1 conserved hypothetical protein [Culex quinquefasciatus]